MPSKAAVQGEEYFHKAEYNAARSAVRKICDAISAYVGHADRAMVRDGALRVQRARCAGATSSEHTLPHCRAPGHCLAR